MSCFFAAESRERKGGFFRERVSLRTSNLYSIGFNFFLLSFFFSLQQVSQMLFFLSSSLVFFYVNIACMYAWFIIVLWVVTLHAIMYGSCRMYYQVSKMTLDWLVFTETANQGWCRDEFRVSAWTIFCCYAIDRFAMCAVDLSCCFL